MSDQSSNSLLAHSLEISNVPTSPRCSDPEAPQDSSIISYRDLVDALQELEHQVAKFTDRCKQRAAANATTDADEYSSWAAKDDSDSASSVTLDSNDSARGLRTYAQHSAASSDATLSHGNNPEEEVNKEVHIQDLHLVEFGTDTFEPKISAPTLSCAEAPSSHDAHTGSTLAASHMQLSPFTLQGCAEEQNLLGPDHFHHEDEYVETQFDVYNADPDPFACALYSSAQLALFGDFLRSPFALSASPASDAIGINPFDAEAHKAPCECDRCLLMEVALSRDFGELHPFEPWLTERYYEED
ncbi:hypothetical protein ACEPAF_8172 [Sanghuangporus sanghuang]